MIRDPHALITFSARGTNIDDVVAMRGEGLPKLDSGYAKWEVIDRPKRIGATRYVGQDPVRMSIPILFDGWKDDASIEDDVANLILMQAEVSGEPPKITVNETARFGLPIRDYTIRWVIESIDWGDTQIWVNGARQRQDATVHLLRFVDLPTVAVGATGSGNGATGARHKTHVVKKGETLPIIAVKEYGDRTKWKLIAQRNNISDPRRVKVGQVLRLP